VYCATTGGRVFALAPDGTQKWQYPAAGQPGLSSLYSTPAVRSDGSLVFGTSDSAVYALRADGSLLWKAATGDWVDSSPVVTSDGVIYVGCTDKNIYAFSSTATALMTDWAQLLRGPQRTGAQPLGLVAGTAGRLINLSVRTTAGANASTLIVGFTVAGTGSRPLLVRGVGPTLTNFGVTGVLADPQITLFSGNTSQATNDNWGAATNASSIATTADAVGAFALPANSLDAALLSNFAIGGYTVQVTGHNSATGIALMEVYDAGGAPGTARLSNLSARSSVTTGAGVLIAGFVVSDSTRAVLVRGIGPTLSNFGVAGALANPRLRVFSGSQIVAENDDWSAASNATGIAATAQSVGAFALPNGSQDAAMLLTLPPGAYTAQISGANNTTGVGLVEVYELP
jgi:hypothetical protein